MSNGELSGGGITPAAIYARVAQLGAALGLREKLTVAACYAYHDSSIIVPQRRKRVVPLDTERPAHLPRREADDPPSVLFVSPQTSIERLMDSLTRLEEWFGMISRMQLSGNVAPHLEHLCTQLDAQCTILETELASLHQVVKILPLHIIILRLFPQREDMVSDPFLLKLEVCATTVLTDAFLAALPRSLAEEQAYHACVYVAAQELGEENVAGVTDLLQSVVVYAGMHAQRQLETFSPSPTSVVS